MSISYGGDNIQDTDGGVLRPISSVMRNRIINGDFRIDQRNAGASVTLGAVNPQYTLDRWAIQASQASKISVQQNAGSVTTPAGFNKYLGVTSLSAYSVGSGDYYSVRQAVEGLNIADLGWGTANAKTVTLSFQVYSSLTGTFGGSIANDAFNRSYPFTYTVSSANTWTTISVTIAGDTTGTWLTTNGTGLWITFGLGVGSTYNGTAGAWAGAGYLSATGATSVVGTSGATFFLTGVQLEVGSSATGFEYRQYGTELALCQRYYWQGVGASSSAWSSGLNYTSSLVLHYLKYPVRMRTNPTFSYGSLSDFTYISNTNAVPTSLAATTTIDTARIEGGGTSLQVAAASIMQFTSGGGYYAFSSEL